MKTFFNKIKPNDRLKLHLYFKYHFNPIELNNFNNDNFLIVLKNHDINNYYIANKNILNVNEKYYFAIFKNHYSIFIETINTYTISYAYNDKTYRFTLSFFYQ